MLKEQNLKWKYLDFYFLSVFVVNFWLGYWFNSNDLVLNYESTWYYKKSQKAWDCQLIQTRGKEKEEKKRDGEAEWRERKGDGSVDFTIWWPIWGWLGDEEGNEGGT